VQDSGFVADRRLVAPPADILSSSVDVRALILIAILLSGVVARAERRWLVDLQVGPAFLMRSQSHAIGHAFKPMARVGVRYTLTPRIEAGGTLTGLVDADEHYRVWGALAHGRLALWQRPAFSAGAALALGAGYNADILHTDLRAGASPVVPYGFVAVDARWSIGERWLVGAEAGWENLSIVRLGALFGVRL
jgi:hypothetical protein